jgi:hypothetical protein
MKTLLQIIFTSLLIFVGDANAKCQCGIYLNAEDYRNNKLSYETACTNNKHLHLHLHDFF